jgi:hypothetical protein
MNRQDQERDHPRRRRDERGRQIYAVAVVTAVTFAFTDAADFGALPALAGRDRLVAAWSLLSGSTSAVTAAGPAWAASWSPSSGHRGQ